MQHFRYAFQQLHIYAQAIKNAIGIGACCAYAFCKLVNSHALTINFLSDDLSNWFFHYRSFYFICN